MVFDMSSYDEHDQNYLQIGITELNLDGNPGKNHYNCRADTFMPEDHNQDSSTMMSTGKTDPYNCSNYEEGR